MTRQASVIVGLLVATVIGLAITVGVMATDDDHDNARSHMMGSDSGYQGMMGAIGEMDSADMLQHMREVLGEDGYQRMLAHMAQHQSGDAMPNDAGMDQLMHRMMDGMMGQMPMANGTVMPPGSDSHHETPTATP